MFIDASALASMVARENDSDELAVRLARAAVRITSPLSVWEAAVAVSRIVGIHVEDASDEVHDFLTIADIELRPVPPEASRLALDAYARYGKGRHPAALNFGDCFSYACARLFGEPLLYKGNDFARTDIETA